MERQTVDFGIDLGTTNSVMARATPAGVEIVSNTLEGESTPSAVAMTGTGQILVGQDALDTPSAITKFKRQMGTTNNYSLGNGETITPEQLSGEVLKELKAGAQMRYDVQPDYVVITVPAMFLQPQCEATHKAAEIAGLNAVTLLQEPIAAATAYLDNEAPEGNYLVYDLGGGTFDVSIVRLRNREMNVIAHGGDNYLGGTDLDAAIFEWLLGQITRTHGVIPEVERQPLRDQLLRACEATRIRLSSRDTAMIDLRDFDLPISQILLERQNLEMLISPLITRTIELTRQRLDQASLHPSDIRSLFLVGGPTRTPYVRLRLDQELGIPRSHDMNPMTVVARGAAVHASALLKPDRARATISPGSTSAKLELFYNPVAAERETTISGKVLVPVEFTGEVRLTNTSGDWDSGWISLKNHAFMADVLLNQSGGTEFRIMLRDLSGTLVPVEPNAVAMRYGVAAAASVAPYNYGVALDDGSFAVIVESGKQLPTSDRKVLKVAKAIPAGSPEHISIYFVEGMSRVASDNTKVGELKISGTDLSRNLKEGEQIEVRMHMDESRRLKARVHIPLQDLDFSVEMSSLIDKPNTSDLNASLNELGTILSNLELTVGETDQKKVLHATSEKEKLEADLERVERGADDEAEKLAKRLAETKAEVRLVEAKYLVPIAYQKAIISLNDAEKIAADFEDRIGVALTKEMRQEAERCLKIEDEKGLQAIERRADDLYYKHAYKTDSHWIGFVEYLKIHYLTASDPIMYQDYLKRAEECLLRGDLEGVRSFGYKAYRYLPQDKAKENRFHDAGLRQ